jgi:hypothetical protein
MMDLHSKVPLKDLSDPERFDFLKGLKPLIQRVDEVHPSTDNDSHYLFLVWLKNPDDTETVRRHIVRNHKKAVLDHHWSLVCLPDTGEGLIIVSTWF